ncbi:MAG: imidazole glycerol phosphate synthase subunit HisH [Planctomycetes bacterium]|nr:imidazole glycerol phosphate synthase subunit HisH [Planctomycetota bacterium]
MIVVVDYCVGNVSSVRNMLKRLCHESVISGDPTVIGRAHKLILPGVGAFDYGMQQLTESGIADVLRARVLEARVPLLGICLGAQLLTRRSDEGRLPGLGWFDAETVGFDRKRLASELRVPHMGWADVDVVRPSRLFEGLCSDSRFYFVHSFHLVCNHSDDVVATAEHGYTFAAGIERGHIAGVQFHPEKSHKYGMCVLDNFARRF